MSKRNFGAAVNALETQAWLADLLQVPTSKLLPGLIRNTEYVVDRAVLKQEITALRPYLSRLSDRYPKLPQARIWHAKSLILENPEAAFGHLELAAKLLPVEQQIYRIAVEAALQLRKPALATQWCQRYRHAQLGDKKGKTIFLGFGARTLALVVDRQDGTAEVIANEGVQLGERRTYDFLLSETAQQTPLHLHMALVGGITARLHGLTIVGPDERRQYKANELIITSRDGYVSASGEILLGAGTDVGTIMTVRPKEEAFGPFDRIDFIITFNKLALTSLPGCRTAE